MGFGEGKEVFWVSLRVADCTDGGRMFCWCCWLMLATFSYYGVHCAPKDDAERETCLAVEALHWIPVLPQRCCRLTQWCLFPQPLNNNTPKSMRCPQGTVPTIPAGPLRVHFR